MGTSLKKCPLILPNGCPFYSICQLIHPNIHLDADLNIWLEKHCPEQHITIHY